MMTETEDVSLVFDLEAVLRADGEVDAQWPLPQINPLDDMSTLDSDTLGGNWMPTPKESNTRVAPTNQDFEEVLPKKQAPSKGDSRDGRTTKIIYILSILLGPVLLAVICGLAIVLARLRQEEVESSQSASWWDILPKPAPVPPPVDGGDDAPLSSPSTFPLAEPTRLPEETATTPPAYPTNGPAPSSSAPIPTDTPEEARVDFLSIITSRSFESLEIILEDIDSPQHRAFAWITNDPVYFGYGNDRVLQRWVLSVFALGLTDVPTEYNAKASILDSWVQETDECTWFSSQPSSVCNPVGLYERIDIRDANLYGTLPSELSLLSNSLGK
jgi:hypothetical protein